MKTIIKRITILSVMLTLLLGFTAYAEEKEDWLYNNPKQQDIVVVVGYEKDDVKISFKDPEDRPVSLTSANVKYDKLDDNTMFILIKNAAAGNWKLVYDKGSNESIKASAYPAESSMKIKNFRTGTPADQKMNVEFSVTGAGGGSFNYEISISLDKDFATERNIYKGNGYGEDIHTAELNLEGLNDGTYYLKLYAYHEDNGVFDFDEVISDSFEFVNSQKVDPLEDYNVAVNITARTIDISFEGKTPYNAQTVYVKATADGKDLDEQFLDVKSGEYVARTQFDEGVKEISISAALQYENGRVSEELTKTVNLDFSKGAFALELPKSGTSNNKYFTYKYKNAKDQLVAIKINDNYPEEKTFNGKGKEKFELPDINNDVLISYQYEGVTYIAEVYIVVDIYPPSLKIYEDMDGMTTKDDKVIITGKTDAGSRLTVNDEKIETDAKGGFSYELKLEDGVNEVAISSEDDAGNIATYAMKINKDTATKEVGNVVEGEEANKILSFLPLFIALYASIFGIIEMAIIAGGRKKKAAAVVTVKKAAITAFVFSTIAFAADLVLFIIRRKYEKSEDYINLAVDFPKKAYDYIHLTKICKVMLFVLGAVMAVSLITMIAAILIKKFRDPARAEAKKKAKEEARLAKEAAAKAKAEAEAKARAEAAERAKAEAEARAKAAEEARAKAEAERAEREKQEAEARAKAEAERAEREKQEAEVRAKEEEERAEREKAQAEAKAAEETKPVETANLSETAKPQTPPVNRDFKFCTGCGKKLPITSMFCSNCGKKQ